ncbi:TatD family hydrolase [Candidatus Laterigemmans baculatus]|uniref:TatD family hydrolase n=1 Tax=Candidatus Laterigemmans baculatus TaxID=2770505 RepID=UPI0013DBA690|nr:TatD family hydrolase [Candidatus Laterigemmans baculatus]
MKLFDTHAHLDSEPFDEDREGVLERARGAGLVGICVVGCTVPSSQKCCELAAAHPDLLCAAVGIQPNYVSSVEPAAMEAIAALAERPEVVAIGETGLDGYWQDAPMDLQREFFEQHLELAAQLDKPFIVHMRDSGEEILQVLTPRAAGGPLRGIMHSFTGDWELAEAFLAMGLHLSFAGMVTFKKSAELRHVASRVPADRLLIETDSPYLSPEPLRGKRPNEPARVVHTARCIAEARGVSPESLAELTTENAVRLFRR